MTAHCSDRELIDVLFDLLEPEQAAEVRAHVADCAPCRARQEQLQRTLEQLDLLATDPDVPADWVDRAVAAAGVRRPRRRLWVGWGLAALLAVAVSLPWALRSPGPAVPPSTVSRPLRSAPTPKARTFGEPATPPPARQAALDAAGADPFAERPFAPASAIELVTLPRPEDVELTVYNPADLTLVRQHRRLTLKRGWNWIQLMWSATRIDPTSLELTPLTDPDQVRIEQWVFPPRLPGIGRWLIRSEIDGAVPFELTYLTCGISWRARYHVVLAEDRRTLKRLSGSIRLDNHSGEDFQDARTRLVLGRIQLLDSLDELARRDPPFGRPAEVVRHEWLEDEEWTFEKGVDLFSASGGTGAVPSRGRLFRKLIEQEGLSELTLYRIEGTETLADGWGRRLTLRQARDVPVDLRVEWDPDRWGPEPRRFLSFRNDPNHGLGQGPLPEGRVVCYAEDDGRLSFVGRADAVPYVPVGQEVLWPLGPARDVEVQWILRAQATENHRFDDAGDLAGWDRRETWRLQVTNTAAAPVTVRVTRTVQADTWRLLAGPAERLDTERLRLTVTLAARQHRDIDLTWVTFHGRRAEDMTGDPTTVSNPVMRGAQP